MTMPAAQRSEKLSLRVVSAFAPIILLGNELHATPLRIDLTLAADWHTIF